MEYANYAKHNSNPVDGFILQAPISDREAFKLEFPDTDKSVQVAEQMIAAGKADHIAPREVIPPSLGPAVSAYRLRSLLAKGFVAGIIIGPQYIIAFLLIVHDVGAMRIFSLLTLTMPLSRKYGAASISLSWCYIQKRMKMYHTMWTKES